MTTLADVILNANKPYEKQPTCTNCKGKKQVRVFVRANETRLVPCPVCTEELYMRQEVEDDVGC